MTEPPADDNASEAAAASIAPDAAAGNVTFTRLVAPSYNRELAKNAMQRWLARRLCLEFSACNKLADKLLGGTINREPVTGTGLKNLCADAKRDVALAWFEARKVDAATAERIILGQPVLKRERVRAASGDAEQSAPKLPRTELDCDGTNLLGNAQSMCTGELMSSEAPASAAGHVAAEQLEVGASATAAAGTDAT